MTTKGRAPLLMSKAVRRGRGDQAATSGGTISGRGTRSTVVMAMEGNPGADRMLRQLRVEPVLPQHDAAMKW